MTYQIIDHGSWEIYTPDKLPELAPPKAMFCRRISDGVDWYDFSRNPENWAEGSLRATLDPVPQGQITQAVVRDEHLLFPAGCRLIEILGADPQDPAPHKLFEQRLCDVVTGEFTDVPPPPVTSISSAQAVTALFNRELLDQVEDIAKNHPYAPVRIFYQRANRWEIANPYVQAFAAELGLDAAGLQALFDEADKLVQ